MNLKRMNDFQERRLKIKTIFDQYFSMKRKWNINTLAIKINLSVKQTRRSLKQYLNHPEDFLNHKNLGKIPVNKISENTATKLVFAREKMLEHLNENRNHFYWNTTHKLFCKEYDVFKDLKIFYSSVNKILNLLINVYRNVHDIRQDVRLSIPLKTKIRKFFLTTRILFLLTRF